MAAQTGADEGSAGLSAILLEQADRLFGQFATTDVLGAADRGTFPDALWAACEEAGFPLALVPEEAGGVGLAAGDVAQLIRRSAFHSVPMPLGETIVANALWAGAGGEPVAGPVTLGPTNARDTLALSRPDGGAAALNGTAGRVPWGASAGHVLLLARSDSGGHLCLVPGGLAQATAIRNVANEPRDTLSFDRVRIPADAIRPAPPGLDEAVLLHGAALRTHQMAGAMERCLDHALAYANERVQFGRPIGKLQAVQHMLAIAAGHVAAAIAAADSLAEADGTPGFAFAVAIAKARAGEAAGQVAAICHQVHAAMGFTQEHPLHFATRRLWSWRDEFGAEAFWQARLGRLVCARGGEALWPTVTGETAT